MTMTADQRGRPRPTGAGRALHVMSLSLAALALAGAVTVLALPLPRPAAGGTCGPGSSSEPAVVAFFDPVSIGAGPVPRGADAATVYQWQAFVGQCQSSADARVAESLALLLIAGFFSLAVPPLLRRAWHGHRPPSSGAPAGWYPDPLNSSTWRWWDGKAWSGHASPAAPETGSEEGAGPPSSGEAAPSAPAAEPQSPPPPPAD